VFLTDGRYTEQSAAEVPDLARITYAPSAFVETVAEVASERGVARLAVEAADLSLDGHRRLAEGLEGIELVPTTGVVEAVRMHKSAAEIDAIRRAQRVAEQAVTETLGAWTGGTELDLALALEWAIRTGGAEAVSFEVIVAAGANAALPHARPGPRPVPGDGCVLVDLGARVDGYCSDMTRTWLRGAPDPLPEAHAAVVRALEAGCAAIRPGVTGADVDRAAREVLEAEGFGEAFVHSTGHGVGLDIHEEPRLARTSEATLEEGMVVTVEPGVYLPGVGGIRVEDLVVVTSSGIENLTTLPRGPGWPA
jgi:Xaa-Pro aminopeptidase/Xaa-Pro dipeptidase